MRQCQADYKIHSPNTEYALRRSAMKGTSWLKYEILYNIHERNIDIEIQQKSNGHDKLDCRNPNIQLKPNPLPTLHAIEKTV